jgi:hypothetical protein
MRVGASTSEQLAAIQYVVSEITSASSEPLVDALMDEAARLWIAGYKVGNYRNVPNTELPPDFLEALK